MKTDTISRIKRCSKYDIIPEGNEFLKQLQLLSKKLKQRILEGSTKVSTKDNFHNEQLDKF